MKVFLDDKRPCPEDWFHFTDVYKLIAFLGVHWLCTKEVTHMSLDHDLGNPSTKKKEKDGMMVLDWMEAMIHSGQADYLPIIEVHSSNTPERIRMAKLIVKMDQDLYEMQKKAAPKKNINQVFTEK